MLQHFAFWILHHGRIIGEKVEDMVQYSCFGEVSTAVKILKSEKLLKILKGGCNMQRSELLVGYNAFKSVLELRNLIPENDTGDMM